MTPSLSKEQIEALHASGSGDFIEVFDPNDNRRYCIVDTETHRRAMQALRQQEDWESIQESLAQADRGEAMPIEQADVLMRKELGFPERK